VKSTGYTATMRSRGALYAYALAVAEENAAGGEIVTAPTCGSSGVLPAVLYYLQTTRNFLEIRILRALATAGLFGNVVKTNASISGAEVGCQGEVGVACAMAAAAACQLFGGSPAQIEYAAELALEHHLGLTCDPGLLYWKNLTHGVGKNGTHTTLNISVFSILGMPTVSNAVDFLFVSGKKQTHLFTCHGMEGVF
jgi:hypothetical protein